MQMVQQLKRSETARKSIVKSGRVNKEGRAKQKNVGAKMAPFLNESGQCLGLYTRLVELMVPGDNRSRRGTDKGMKKIRASLGGKALSRSY